MQEETLQKIMEASFIVQVDGAAEPSLPIYQICPSDALFPLSTPIIVPDSDDSDGRSKFDNVPPSIPSLS